MVGFIRSEMTVLGTTDGASGCASSRLGFTCGELPQNLFQRTTSSTLLKASRKFCALNESCRSIINPLPPSWGATTFRHNQHSGVRSCVACQSL